MNDFFGLSMTYIMIALICVFLVAVSTVVWVFVRQRVMFLIGVRNIPRRRAQTVLIIIGLMLSTLIISTAFSIGDTVDYSVTNTAYARLHNIDEVVQAQAESGETHVFEGGGSLISAIPIAQDEAQDLVGRIRGTEGVDGAVSVVRAPVAVQNTAKGQTEPTVVMVGVDPSQLDGFDSDVELLNGDDVDLSALAPDELYANESAADELAIEPGDRLTVFSAGKPHEFTVKGVLRDRLLTGAAAGITQGMVLPLARAQELFERPGVVDFIAVSNNGGPRESVKLSDEVTDRLNETVLLGKRIQADTTKQDIVDEAADASAAIVTLFVVLGLFSIAAGMLLVFLIFVMLAAERKVEMGMVRAVGTKRAHLVQMFMSEGMVYNLGAAAVGALLGIGVSLIMIRIMAQLFSDLDLTITFHVTPRSLIVSYTIGVVLTFLTVTFSSWRIGNLNIVSAIRDTAEPTSVRERPANGAVAFVRWLLFKPDSWRGFFRALGMIVLGAVAGGAGYALFIAAAAVYGAGAAGGIAGVLLGVLGGTLIAAAVVLVLIGFNSIIQPGPLMAIVGPLLMWVGWESAQAFFFGAGFSLLIIGVALVVRFLGAPARPVFTTMGLVMLLFWLLFAGNNVPGLREMEGDIEMFFLSGVTMVIAGTFVLVYNADLMLGLLLLSGRWFSTLVPSIRTAVAYPLANKFRTGMTIAMISLVMFALVMMSTMNENFDRIFLNEDSLGGYDIVASENPGNPVPDLEGALREEGVDTSAFVGVDEIKLANQTVADVAQVKANGKQEFASYNMLGVSDGFLQNNTLDFQARARGYADNESIWKALLENPDLAVIDAFAIPSGGFGDFGGFQLDGIEPSDSTFDPIPLVVRDSANGKLRTVQIIGILHTEASGLYGGLMLTDQAFTDVFGAPESTLHYIRLQPGADDNATALAIEKALLRRGVQADALRKIIDDFQAQSRGFLYLIQGFMGIGLFVGIAAVGVIAFRTVVERRQQIGMLRAIGYTRRAVALSFLMESSFTALLGIGSGVLLAVLLAWQLVSTDEFVPGGVDQFYIPWVQILVVSGFAFLASLVMTIIPARQASNIPIAEALRYE